MRTGPSVVAIIGAATGITGVVWNLLRAVRERERLHVIFYVFHEEIPLRRGPVAHVDMLNMGKFPAHVVGAAIVDELPWVRKWPFRLIGFRTRHRRPFRWLLGRSRAWYLTVPNFEPGVLPPRELMQIRVDDNVAQIEQWARERRWVVVDTAIRPYVARVTDNRPRQ